MNRGTYFPSFLWNSVAKLGDFGFAYVFSVLLARILEPADYGTFASILSVSTLVIVLASTGIDTTLHKFLGETGAAGGDTRSVPPLIRALLGARLALTAVLVAAAFFARGWIASRFQNEAMAGLISSSALYLVAQSLALFGANALVGLLKTRSVAVFTVCVRLANIGLAYALVRSGAGVQEIMLMLGWTSAALAVAYAFAVLPLARGASGPSRLSPAFTFAAISWVLAAVSFGLGRQSDVIILNAIRHDQTEVALYDVAYSLAQTVPMVLTIGLSGIALALFSKRHRSRPEGLAPLWRTFVVVVGAVTLPLFMFMIVNARACVTLIYGERYGDAGALLRIYAIPMVVYWVLGGGASSTALHAANRIRTVLVIRTVVGLVNIAANVFLVRAWGAAGALLGTGVCGAAACVWELAAVTRATRAAPPVRHLAGIACAIAVALAPSVIARPAGLAALAGHGAVFVGVFLVALRFLRPLPPLDEGLVAALPPAVAAALAAFTRDPVRAGR
jgi:O-antigen/teichoic acid export membrane protein